MNKYSNFIITISLTVGAIILAPISSVAQVSAENHYNQAREYLDNNEYSQAIKYLNQAIELEPNLVQAHITLGIIYLTQRKYETAIAKLNRAIAIDPTRPSAYINRASARARVGKYREAIVDLEKGEQLLRAEGQITTENYRDIGRILGHIYTERGIAFNKQKKWESAIKDFNRAIEAFPNEGATYYHRAEAYAQLGQLEKAEEDAKKAAQIFQSEGDTENYLLTQQLFSWIQSQK